MKGRWSTTCFENMNWFHCECWACLRAILLQETLGERGGPHGAEPSPQEHADCAHFAPLPATWAHCVHLGLAVHTRCRDFPLSHGNSQAATLLTSSSTSRLWAFSKARAIFTGALTYFLTIFKKRSYSFI